jgi:hypothetical protein
MARKATEASSLWLPGFGLDDPQAFPNLFSERRSPQRAKNVTRPVFKTRTAATPTVEASRLASARAKTGTEDWASF